MNVRRRTTLAVIISAVVWIAVMGLVYRTYHREQKKDDLAALSADVTAKGEVRQYYAVYHDGVKTGYLIVSRISVGNLRVLREEAVIKLNISGMSREVFTQSTAGIDSANMRMEYADFRMSSGTHTFTFNSALHGDSLLINVRMNAEAPWRRGAFITGGRILPAVALPFRMQYLDGGRDSVSVFDPIVFGPRPVRIVRGNTEMFPIAGRPVSARRFDIGNGGRSVVWLDSLGWMVRGENIELFGPSLGGFTVERSESRDVFLLPVETKLGGDAVRSWRVAAGKTIPNPRMVTYLEVELDGVRAATVDTESPMKTVRSLNPVVFAITSRPAPNSGRLLELAADTSLVGSGDYIQPRDARIARLAVEIAGAGDTLVMARALNRWVYARIAKDSAAAITRSVDVLRAMRGGRDEHTKLFAALARSLGIPVQVNAGLVYENGAFRYHSWPSVLAKGMWYDLDPWYGEDIADATHIALIRGDFERLPEILRLIGSLSARIIAYR